MKQEPQAWVSAAPPDWERKKDEENRLAARSDRRNSGGTTKQRACAEEFCRTELFGSTHAQDRKKIS
jgi:hypothetical protein